MKRPLFLYVACAALLILVAAAPRSSAVLVTYFNFNDNNTTSDLPGVQTTVITQSNLAPSFTTGTTLNLAPGDPLPAAGSAVRLTDSNNGNGNPKYFQFTVNTIGLQNLSLSYATQTSVSQFTQTIFYSIDGGANFISVGVFVPSTTGFNTGSVIASFNLPAAVNNLASVIIRVGMTNNGQLKDQWNDFDNIQLNAAAIPEPATVTGGALALAAVGYMQRRRLRRLLPGTRRKPS